MSTLQQMLCVHDRRVAWLRAPAPLGLAHVLIGKPVATFPGHARTFLILALMPCWLALAGCSASLVRPEIYAVSTAAPVHRSEAYEVSAVATVHRTVETRPRRLRAMLAPQAAPDCEFKGSDAEVVDADVFARLKLDYERHCYQHAEALVRSRLRQLQVSGLCEAPPVRRRQRFMRIAPAF
jgi:hypothetical protein